MGLGLQWSYHEPRNHLYTISKKLKDLKAKSLVEKPYLRSQPLQEEKGEIKCSKGLTQDI